MATEIKYKTGYGRDIDYQKNILENTKNTRYAREIAKGVRATLKGLERQIKFAARQREDKIALVGRLTQGEVDPSVLSLGTTIKNLETIDTTNFAKDLERIKEIDAMAREIIGRSYVGYIAAAVGVAATGLAVYAAPAAITAYFSYVNGTGV